MFLKGFSSALPETERVSAETLVFLMGTSDNPPPAHVPPTSFSKSFTTRFSSLSLYMSRFVPFFEINVLLMNEGYCSIFSDVAGDITIVVDGEPFLLHKVSDYTHTHTQFNKIQLNGNFQYCSFLWWLGVERSGNWWQKR